MTARAGFKPAPTPPKDGGCLRAAPDATKRAGTHENCVPARFTMLAVVGAGLKPARAALRLARGGCAPGQVDKVAVVRGQILVAPEGHIGHEWCGLRAARAVAFIRQPLHPGAVDIELH